MKYKHKTTGEEAKQNISNYYDVGKEQIHKRFIENSCDWGKVEELNYEVINYRDYYDRIFPNFYYGYCINSVKRLSDEEVFTLGDEVTDGDDKTVYKIFRFTELKDCIQVCAKSDTTYRKEIYYSLDSVLKLKKVLFTTEDGIDIFENDKFFWVDRRSLKLGEYTTIYTNIPNTLYFSTKESAEEYILFNKPCLSLNNIESIATINWFDRQALIEFIKSKL